MLTPKPRTLSRATYRLTVAAALAAGLALGGCGQKEDKEKNVTISRDGGKVTIQAGDGQSKVEITTNGEGPAPNLPDFVPAYPGGKVQSTIQGNGDGGHGGGVIYMTKDKPADVIAFYKKKAKDMGMGETMNMQNGGSWIFVATSKDKNQHFNVNAIEADDGSQVSVFWSTDE